MQLGSPESGWKEILPGVRVQFAPITRKAARAAREACGMVLRTTDGDFVEASDTLTAEFLRRGIIAWEGVTGADGNAIAPSDLVPALDANGEPRIAEDGAAIMEAAVEQFIRDAKAVEAAELIYVRLWLDRDTEKNVSAASSPGTSEAATAASDTAKSSATRASKAVASRTRKPKTKKSGLAAHI